MLALREQCEKVLSAFLVNLDIAAKLDGPKVICDSTNNNAETVRDGYMYATCEIPRWLAIQCGLVEDDEFLIGGRSADWWTCSYLNGWQRQWARTRTKNSKR